MSDHTEDFPSELGDIDERLRSARPAPSEQALERAMTRAERAQESRKPSLLWASAPRMSGRFRAIAVAGACALVAMTGGAAVLNSSGSGGSGTPTFENALHNQYCGPGLVFLQAQLESLQLQLSVLPDIPANAIIRADLLAQIADLQADIGLCVSLP